MQPVVEVSQFRDEALDLHVILAVHRISSDQICIGGCRLMPYRGETEAIAEAMRLATCMSLKYLVAGLPFGGLKLVVLDHDPLQRRECFRRIGEWVDAQEGTCYIATDMGTSLDDMADASENTGFVVEKPGCIVDGTCVDLLSRGVMASLEAALGEPWGLGEFGGRRAIVQGLGKAGLKLAEDLIRSGCTVWGCDVDPAREILVRKLGAGIVGTSIRAACDYLVPCGGVGSIGTAEAGYIEARAIAGAANLPAGQAEEDVLLSRGIAIIPDFVASAGAVLVDDMLVAGQRPSVEIGYKRTVRIHEVAAEAVRAWQTTGVSPRRAALELLGARKWAC